MPHASVPPPPGDVAALLRSWSGAAHAALQQARAEIDALNVYPVPDGDTGTNLEATLASAAGAVAALPAEATAEEVARALSSGALLGARGSSGTILSALLRGFADALAGGADLAAALAAASAGAQAAVAFPVEGTVLTVARAAADGAVGDDPAAVVRSARRAAAEALARTTDQLPVLKAAGVVDAGGRGWCVVLEALEAVVTGERPQVAPLHVVPRTTAHAVREAGSDAFAYEVQFLLRDTTDDRVAALRTRLGELGDALVVVGGEGLFSVHVHVNDVGAAVEAGVDAGRPFRIAVTRFADATSPTRPTSRRRLLASAPWPGLARALEDAGVEVVDAASLAGAVEAAGEALVLALPELRAAAEQLQGAALRVVPVDNVPELLAAACAVDPDRALDDEVAALRAAAAATRTAAVSRTDGGVEGSVEGGVELHGTDPVAVATRLVDWLLSVGGDLLTLVVGAGTEGEPVVAHVQAHHPAVEVVVVDGGQPEPYLLGVE